MSPTESWTVKRLLEWTTDFFTKKGIDAPRLEAEILLAAAMRCKRIELYTNFDAEPGESERTLYREFVKRRGAGEPVAYLVGFREFFSIPFKVDRNVLIPRPETERLVVEALDLLKTFPPGAAPAVCDVGTGSGAIAVALAKNWPKKSLAAPRITAVDLSPEAIELARQNAQAAGVADRIEFRCSDLLADVEGPFDLIVSNPPYVSEPEYAELPDDVRNYEPRQALLAGPTGTEVIRRLIEQAGPKLRDGGCLILESSPMIVDAVADLLADWKDVRILKDDAIRERFVIAEKPRNTSRELCSRTTE